MSFKTSSNLLYNGVMVKHSLLRPTLILFYGYPGAGKTFVARQLANELQAAHVQDDRIRGELFEQPRFDRQENEIVGHLMEYMTEEFLKSGVSVIYDTNAMRKGQRRNLRELARKCKAASVLIWLQIDLETAFDRVVKRDKRKLDDRYALQIDRTTFENIVHYMQNPDLTEDYVVLSGKHTFGTQSQMTRKKLLDMGLLTIDTAGSHTVKPELVNRIPNPAAGRVDPARRSIFIRQ